MGFAPDKWIAPARVEEALRNEAKVWVQAMSVGKQSAGSALIQRWLGSLLPFIAMKGTTHEQVKIKIGAYASQMQTMPEYLFTNTSLGDAARFFKWFPDFSDLMDWLEKQDVEHRQRLERAEAIARGQDDPNAPPQWSREAGERRKEVMGSHVTRELQELIDIVDERDRQSGWAAKDPRPTAPPLPHEDTPPEQRTRAQEIDRINVLSAHRKVCEAWGNRMRERDLAALRLAKQGKSHV